MLVAAGCCASQVANQQMPAPGALSTPSARCARRESGSAEHDADLFRIHRQRDRTESAVQCVVIDSRATRRLEVIPVPVAVGESPGHMAVGACDQQWRARQRDSDQIEWSLLGAGGDSQPRPVPDGWHTQAQVHVIGDQGGTGAGQPAGNGPIVAAEIFALEGRDHVLKSPLPRIETRVLSPRSKPPGPLIDAAVPRRPRLQAGSDLRMASYVQHFGGRHRCAIAALAGPRRIPQCGRRPCGKIRRIPSGSCGVQELRATFPSSRARRSAEAVIQLATHDRTAADSSTAGPTTSHE